MTKAFGNKSQQTNMVTGNQTKSFENPEAALGQNYKHLSIRRKLQMKKVH